tara:strand:- start:3402 stop:4466 length:1065 start_codon:yes stop_codon:yes gene_type:complete
MPESIRDYLNEAMDASEDDLEETPQVVERDEEPEPDELENSLENEGESEGEAEATPAEAEATPAEAEATPAEGDEKPDTRSLKAPIDWSPKEREDWSRIPPHLQAKIKEREQSTQNLMQETSEARRTHKEFSELTNKYGAVLSGAVKGDTPMQAVQGLFDTVANLRMGNPVQKAQIVADLIESFGVDIRALDSQLSGSMPDPNDPSSRIDELVNQRLAPYQEHLQQMEYQKTQQTQQVQQEATQEVQSFAESGKAEFLNDVRHDMADMIDAAYRRGVNMPMQEAYQKACAVHPQISQIMQQRDKQQQITGGNNNMQSKRLAASSITGSRVGVNTPSGNMSIRDTISSAWDSQGE